MTNIARSKSNDKLTCGCSRDGSFVCAEHARWEPPTSPDEIANQIHSAIAAIEAAPESPEGAGISHFGLHMTIGTEVVSLSQRGSLLLVTIYRSHGAGLIGGRGEPVTCPACGHTKHPPTYIHPGYSENVHRKRMDALAKRFKVKVQEHWNGLDGQNGISIVLKRPCPPSLAAALQRGATSPVSYSDWASEVTKGMAQ